ncbi:hypothetical protein [Streptomyces aidingensis]|uniref:Integral membrane protein n=1 Tax=Streptomyces aidingensis TaxID=910347 RepID=A0A1I1PLT8_9ACTN|nr:hypothetical protein [Streptomyces aidingensis]SFD07933.1 hypothetical protein SAMN05421773_109124 [Streptomyces aidingensis]
MAGTTAEGNGGEAPPGAPAEPGPRSAPGPVPAAAPAGERTPAPALELLVHGVGGARPEEMLGDPRTERITGDGTASVHRRTEDARDRLWDDRQPLREAYTWSNLTSGNGARALWLLLLPFMIVNMAHWMRPPAGGHRTTHRVYDIAGRLLALSLTVLLVCGACAVALDLFAWQCAATESCAGRRDWTGFLAGGNGWWTEPGRRLLLAAALPLLLIWLLWWLSHRTWSAYESAYPPPLAELLRGGGDRGRRPGPGTRPGGSAAAGHPNLLALPGFWFGRGIVSRLRAAHTCAGLLTVGGALLTASWRYDHGPHGSAPLAAASWLLAALLVTGCAAVLLVIAAQGRTELEYGTADDRCHPLILTWLPAATGVLLALVLLHTAWHRPGWHSTGMHPGNGVFTALTVTQGVLLAVLAAAALRLHRRSDPARRGVLGGLAGPCCAVLACALAAVLTGGAVQRLADWLDPGSRLGTPGTIPGPTVLLSWQAAAIPTLLAVVLLLALPAGLSVWRQTRRLAPGVRDAYPEEQGGGAADDLPHERHSLRVAGAVARARLTDSAPRLVGAVGAAGVLLGFVAVAGAGLTGEAPRAAAEDTPGPLAGFAAVSQAAGSWVMGIGVVLLLAVGRRAYRDHGARRTIGILWDVGTFWPRSAHPFAPPCYAERAVPDLTWRMTHWTGTTGGTVVISGHSQGSVLAAAAVWQLDPATRRRVALLTHGSPLCRLYGRWFPKYFGPHALAGLAGAVPRWRNLWRHTDPIGGPVGVTGPDGAPVDRAALRDPQCFGRTPRRPLPEPVLGHGDYAADPAYAEERAALHRALAGRPAFPVPEQPAPPHTRGKAPGTAPAGG